MAKKQQHGNKEPKKPKKQKAPAAPKKQLALPVAK